MFRKIALTLLILLSVVAVLPFADSAARGLGRSMSWQRHHRRHSRKWWRRHRARMRRLAHERAMAHRDAVLRVKPLANVAAPAVAEPTLPVPTNGWNSIPAPHGEVMFRAAANPTDQARLSVVAMSRPNPAYLTHKEQKEMLSGVSFAELRRTVIDKMIAAGGWVSNDFERDVDGRRVFVVTAQTPANGRTPDKALNFYFTEVNGRIYSLATEANVQSAERMASEAEKFIANLH